MTAAMHCDGPDCEAWTYTLTDGWYTVTERYGYQQERDYCSTDCMIRDYASVEPITEVPL